MRARILITLVSLVVLAVAALFVPAALSTRSRHAADQEVELQRDATVVANGLPIVDTASGDLAPGTVHHYALYSADGSKVAGEGPPVAEPEILAALDGDPTLATVDGDLVAGLLIRTSDPTGPFVLRASESRDEAATATQRSVVRLGAVALAVVAAAVVAAWLLSSRLARPVESLRSAAARLDDGDLQSPVAPSGIAEVDDVAAALTRTGARVRRSLARERAFSAEASHQLRTPLTAIRSAVEAEQIDPRPAPSPILEEILDQIDHLETTVVGLLELARDTHQDRSPVDLRDLADATASRWAPAFADRRRTLELNTGAVEGRPRVAQAAVIQALDVLLDNALRHGKGTVRLNIGDLTGGVAVTVADEGQLDASRLFERRQSDSSTSLGGIGLPLARTLVEAEGGRLRLVRAAPSTFQITFPTG